MKKSNPYLFALLAVCVMAGFGSCDEDDDAVKTHDINTAENVSVDRFSATAGHLMVRDAVNGLPAANTAVNFDQAPFITKGLGHLGRLWSTTTLMFSLSIRLRSMCSLTKENHLPYRVS